MIQDAIKILVEMKNLSVEIAEGSMNEIMEGTATPAQIAAFITALRMKGETSEEIFALASVMRKKAHQINAPKGAIDLCGTGGDCSSTFNISTASAFVAAGAGIPVAKHGNRSVSSKCGSADVLHELGVNIMLNPEEAEKCLEKTGICFLFAPVFHEAMKFAIGPRKEIGIRTVFNVLGPLTNPARVKHQLVGVYDEEITEKIAEALMKLGNESALVVHGSGLDECTISGKTKVSELKDGKIRTYSISPEEFGFRRAEISELAGGDAKRNAEIIISILEGKEKGPKLDAVLFNAGAAIYASGKAKGIAEGIELARKSVSSGSALKKLEQLRVESNAFSQKG